MPYKPAVVTHAYIPRRQEDQEFKAILGYTEFEAQPPTYEILFQKTKAKPQLLNKALFGQ